MEPIALDPLQIEEHIVRWLGAEQGGQAIAVRSVQSSRHALLAGIVHVR
jgi:hypothetical protein